MSRFSGFLMHKRDCTPSMRHKKICASNLAGNEAQIRKKGECAQGGLVLPSHNRRHAPGGAPKFVFFTGMATGHRRYAGKPHPSPPPQGEGAV